MVKDGERDTVVGLNRINLVPRLGPVKIDLSLLVQVVHRDTVRIAVLAVNREDATPLGEQDILALLLGELLLEAPHLPEHGPAFPQAAGNPRGATHLCVTGELECSQDCACEGRYAASNSPLLHKFLFLCIELPFVTPYFEGRLSVGA